MQKTKTKTKNVGRHAGGLSKLMSYFIDQYRMN
jgi:hypothetical protein